MSIKVGTKGYKEETVTPDKTAEAVGSGSLPVYATPMMLALIEKAAWTSVRDQLDDGQGTVGTNMNVNHVASSPVGIKVWAETEVTEVDGRKITYSVKAYDEKGLIGEGTHERFVIFNEKFMAKCQSKL